MSARHVAGLIAHLIVCALYVPLHNYGVDVYISMFGGLTSRGVGIGMTNELMFYFFVLVNGIVFFVPGVKYKLGVVFLMAALILFYFLPRYPVRAMAYSVLGVFLSVAAIGVRIKLEHLFGRLKN